MPVNNAFAVDFDGTASTERFINDRESGIVAGNPVLFNFIHRIGGKRGRLYIGTNRQSVQDDSINAGRNKTGSAYPQYTVIAKSLGMKLDKFLLPDIYNNLKTGKSFKQALSLLKKGTQDYDKDKLAVHLSPDWLHDESKLTILYPQIHRFAKKHPKGPNHFYFLDDREDIVKGLYLYFKKYPQLLPKNTSLILGHFKGETADPAIELYEPIIGDGPIDFNYKQTVKNIASACIQSESFQQQYPSSSLNGKPIRTYEDAKACNFVITTPLNGVRDYQPNLESFVEKKAPATSLSSKGSRFKFFNGAKKLAPDEGLEKEPTLTPDLTSTDKEIALPQLETNQVLMRSPPLESTDDSSTDDSSSEKDPWMSAYARENLSNRSRGI